MKDYNLTIGLEIHAELKTRTKMFCDSKNPAGKEALNGASDPSPNTDICPICMGYPGTLPVINKEAVRSILRLGVALGGKIADNTYFDRKNYFYPDIPKGYQISQYKDPLVSGGSLVGVEITRIHLEEDTAKSIHDKGDQSLLDFNRAGVPLMELVTEPVIHDAATAATFAKELQLLLNYLDIADANMEKGEMRIEANISVSKSADKGTKVEVKNLNSFKAVESAIKFEFERQSKLLDEGGEVRQETRGWDENRGETFSQRAKEESHDYRYFPEPDLPSLSLSAVKEFSHDELKSSLPELPQEKRDRMGKTWGLKEQDIEIYVTNPEKGVVFEEVMGIIGDTSLGQLVSNYLLTDIKRNIKPEVIAETILMVGDGSLSSRGAKDLFNKIPEEVIDARKFAQENNLLQESDREVLKKIIEEVRQENPGAPTQFLTGLVMKRSNNRANPIVLKEILEQLPNIKKQDTNK